MIGPLLNLTAGPDVLEISKWLEGVAYREGWSFRPITRPRWAAGIEASSPYGITDCVVVHGFMDLVEGARVETLRTLIIRIEERRMMQDLKVVGWPGRLPAPGPSRYSS